MALGYHNKYRIVFIGAYQNFCGPGTKMIPEPYPLFLCFFDYDVCTYVVF